MILFRSKHVIWLVPAEQHRTVNITRLWRWLLNCSSGDQSIGLTIRRYYNNAECFTSSCQTHLQRRSFKVHGIIEVNNKNVFRAVVNWKWKGANSKQCILNFQARVTLIARIAHCEQVMLWLMAPDGGVKRWSCSIVCNCLRRVAQ